MSSIPQYGPMEATTKFRAEPLQAYGEDLAIREWYYSNFEKNDGTKPRGTDEWAVGCAPTTAHIADCLYMAVQPCAFAALRPIAEKTHVLEFVGKKQSWFAEKVILYFMGLFKLKNKYSIALIDVFDVHGNVEYTSTFLALWKVLTEVEDVCVNKDALEEMVNHTFDEHSIKKEARKAIFEATFNAGPLLYVDEMFSDDENTVITADLERFLEKFNLLYVRTNRHVSRAEKHSSVPGPDNARLPGLLNEVMTVPLRENATEKEASDYNYAVTLFYETRYKDILSTIRFQQKYRMKQSKRSGTVTELDEKLEQTMQMFKIKSQEAFHEEFAYEIQQSGFLLVLPRDVPPFGYYDQSGQMKFISTIILEMMSEHFKFNVEWATLDKLEAAACGPMLVYGDSEMRRFSKYDRYLPGIKFMTDREQFSQQALEDDRRTYNPPPAKKIRLDVADVPSAAQPKRKTKNVPTTSTQTEIVDVVGPSVTETQTEIVDVVGPSVTETEPEIVEVAGPSDTQTEMEVDDSETTPNTEGQN